MISIPLNLLRLIFDTSWLLHRRLFYGLMSTNNFIFSLIQFICTFYLTYSLFIFKILVKSVGSLNLWLISLPYHALLLLLFTCLSEFCVSLDILKTILLILYRGCYQSTLILSLSLNEEWSGFRHSRRSRWVPEAAYGVGSKAMGT